MLTYAYETSKEVEIGMGNNQGKREPLICFPKKLKPHFYAPAYSNGWSLYKLSFAKHRIDVSFSEEEIRFQSSLEQKLDGIQLSYNTLKQEGILELYKDGILKEETVIDGHLHKFMLNLFTNTPGGSADTMMFETWNRRSYEAPSLEAHKTGPQVAHDFGREEISFNVIDEDGNRSFWRKIFVDRDSENGVIQLKDGEECFFNITYANGDKEQVSMVYDENKNFIQGTKIIYKKGKLASSGHINRNEQYQNIFYQYDEKGQKTVYREVCGWLINDKILKSAEWATLVSIFACSSFFAAKCLLGPEKLDTQTPPAIKNITKQAHTKGE